MHPIFRPHAPSTGRHPPALARRCPAHASLAIVGFALLATQVGCGGAMQSQKKTETPLAGARRAQSEGRLNDAERLGKRAAEDGSLSSRLAYGEILVLRGKHRDAAKIVTPLVKKHPKNREAASLLARSLDGAGDTDKAIAAYAESLRLTPKNKAAAVRLTELLLSKGDAKMASRVAGASLKTHPNDPDLLTLLSRARLARGMLPAALDAAQQATKIQPDGARGWLQLAKCQTALGEQRLAIEAYRRCLGTDPQHSDALMGLGGLLVQQREYKQAADVLKRAVQVSPDDPRGHNALAAVYNRLQQHDNAVESMRRAHALNPRHPLLLRNLVEVMLDAGHAKEAAELADSMAAAMNAEGVSETTKAGLRRTLVRALVIAAVAEQICGSAPKADVVAQNAIAALRRHGLAATRAVVTRFAAEATPQAKAAARRCRKTAPIGGSVP